MKYINENSNRGLVNLFSDYIVNQINKDKQYDVVIEITDCGKFFIVNGLTNSNKILDMTKLKSSFLEEYKELLSQGLVAPTNMEIYTVNVDGSDLKQITHLGKANWAPFYHPSQKKIIFSSNHHSTRGYDFQLYMIDIDGNNVEKITNASIFNAFK